MMPAPLQPRRFRWRGTCTFSLSEPTAAFTVDWVWAVGHPAGASTAKLHGPTFASFAKVKIQSVYMRLLYSDYACALLKQDINENAASLVTALRVDEILEQPGGALMFPTAQAVTPTNSQKQWKSIYKPGTPELCAWNTLLDVGTTVHNWKTVKWFRVYMAAADFTSANLTQAKPVQPSWHPAFQFDLYLLAANPVQDMFVGVRERNLNELQCEIEMHKNGCIDVIDLTQFGDE